MATTAQTIAAILCLHCTKKNIFFRKFCFKLRLSREHYSAPLSVPPIQSLSFSLTHCCRAWMSSTTTTVMMRWYTIHNKEWSSSSSSISSGSSAEKKWIGKWHPKNKTFPSCWTRCLLLLSLIARLNSSHLFGIDHEFRTWSLHHTPLSRILLATCEGSSHRRRSQASYGTRHVLHDLQKWAKEAVGSSSASKKHPRRDDYDDLLALTIESAKAGSTTYIIRPSDGDEDHTINIFFSLVWTTSSSSSLPSTKYPLTPNG